MAIRGYHIKVSLEGSQPPIYRKIRIPTGLSFQELHLVIQCAMGWEDYHLYEFYSMVGEISTTAIVDSFLSNRASIGYTYNQLLENLATQPYFG